MIETPYRPWMHSLLDRMKELYGKVDAKTIAEALPDGGFFKIKGSVATVDDLPATGNTVGDIFIVSADGSEHIWVTSEDRPDGYWEQLGSTESIIPEPIPEYAGYSLKATEDGLISWEPDVYVVRISGTSKTVMPMANHRYEYGELTSLTISNPPSTGAYSIVFTSGSTPTQTTFPATILGLEDFAAEANTMYEINVLDNRAVVGSWAVSSS